MINILIADDSAAEREYILFLIKKNQYEVVYSTAANGEEALEQMRHGTFDLLITDIKMPFMDGIELTKEALSLNPALEIIIISGYSDFTYAKSAISLGVNEYLLKPIDPEEFQRVMDKLIRTVAASRLEAELSSLKNQYTKNHILMQLFSGKEGGPGSSGPNEKLVEHVISPYCTLIVIEFKSQYSSIDILSLEAVLSPLLTGYLYHCINLTPAQSVLLLEVQNPEALPDHNATEMLCNDLLNLITGTYPIPCVLAFDCRIERRQLQKAYVALEELLENSFLTPEAAVFFPGIHTDLKSKDLSEASIPAPELARSKLKIVKQYIYDNYGSDLSIEVLAGQVYIHPNYLSRIFKRDTGCNLNKFIKAYRMEKAKEMLETTQKKVSAIGSAVGYQNSSYFCQTFSDYFGISPEKYRQKDSML